MRLAPAHVPGSTNHPEGIVECMECVGAFVGEPKACAAALRKKLEGKLESLDTVDQLKDTEHYKHSRIHKYQMVTK